jgi:NADH-quinone oxidoreductase subunit F
MDVPRKLASTRDLKTLIAANKAARDSEKRPVLTVSAGTCGQARGSLKVIDALRKTLKKENLEDRVKVKVTGCHGFCEVEPNIIIYPRDIFYQKVDGKRAKDIISQTILNDKVLDDLLYMDPATQQKSAAEGDIPFYKKQKRLVLGDNALIDPTDIGDYLSIGGYGSLAKALETLTPEEVIAEVKVSGLRGRGGAGFLTGLKWELARKAKGDLKYIICNADEGDPGAYMDRSLMEGNPHRVLEGSGRLRLRRGNRLDRLDRRPRRRTPSAAALPGDAGTLAEAHDDQQRGDLGECSDHHRQGSRLVRPHRNGREQGDQDIFPRRKDQ